MAKNAYKVPKKQWRKWSKDAQRVFNRVFSLMGEVKQYLHPQADTPKREHWRTTRWNAAWTAAQATDRKW